MSNQQQPQVHTSSADAKKSSELDNILHYNQNVLDRLIGFEGRLGGVKERLTGVDPVPSAENLNADTAGGLIGQLQSTQQATSSACDSIAEWLDRIEDIV